MKKQILTLALLVSITLGVLAQTGTTPTGNKYTPEEYDRLKSSGQLPAGNHTIVLQSLSGADTLYNPGLQTRGGSAATCGCYVEPDGTYIQAMAPNDDGSSALINLPFTFCLYGDNYTSLYINNNGNVSFGTTYGTFSANAFPDPTYVMVAPFWADVDTRGAGQVVYKIYPNAIYINWVGVGYFSNMTDKLNTFQLILSDGTDPVVGIGNNVAFCYKEMEWTTGAASSGVNGFGGVPATVGSNRGNGTDFVQFGQFDQPGGAYDGPFGLSDGVDWLDFGTFKFNSCVSGSNVAPILSGVTPSTSSGSGSGIACGDTMQICGTGDTLIVSASFIAPEALQTINFVVSSPTLSNYSVISQSGGTVAIMIVSSVADAGFNQLDITATDNGTPNMSTTFPLFIYIDTTGLSNFDPVISGPQEVCVGQSATLDVGNTYDSYQWNTGDTTSTISVNATGTYFVTVGENGCFASCFVDFLVNPLPTPNILGAASGCGDSTELSVDSVYVLYNWSNGITTPTQWVSSGSYTVTVTDTNGCVGTSPSATVALNPYPDAAGGGYPSSLFVNDTTFFMDSSFVSAGSIVSWTWSFGNGDSSNFQNPVYSYSEPGTYTVTLTVVTAAGCEDTYTFSYTVIPRDVIIPNVFSPGNSDGSNDKFEITFIEYYPNSVLTIFDRWGNVVYEKSDYQNTWDGTHYKNGKDLSSGTYFYVLQLSDGKTFNGTVTIYNK